MIRWAENHWWLLLGGGILAIYLVQRYAVQGIWTPQQAGVSNAMNQAMGVN